MAYSLPNIQIQLITEPAVPRARVPLFKFLLIGTKFHVVEGRFLPFTMMGGSFKVIPASMPEQYELIYDKDPIKIAKAMSMKSPASQLSLNAIPGYGVENALGIKITWNPGIFTIDLTQYIVKSADMSGYTVDFLDDSEATSSSDPQFNQSNPSIKLDNAPSNLNHPFVDVYATNVPIATGYETSDVVSNPNYPSGFSDAMLNLVVRKIDNDGTIIFSRYGFSQSFFQSNTSFPVVFLKTPVAFNYVADIKPNQTINAGDTRIYLDSSFLISLGVKKGDILKIGNERAVIKNISRYGGYVELYDPIISDHPASTVQVFFNPTVHKDVSFEFVAIDKTESGVIHQVNNSTVSQYAGVNSPLNPLGYAARIALGGAYDVYVANTGSEEEDDYNSIKDIVSESLADFTFIKVLNEDYEKNWIPFVNTVLSDPSRKKWAVLLVSNPVPDSEEIVASGTGTIHENTLTVSSFSYGGITSIEPGDTVTFDSSEATVISVDAENSVIYLDSNYMDMTVDFVVSREFTREERVEAARQKAMGFNSIWVWAFSNYVTVNNVNFIGYLDVKHIAVYSGTPVYEPKRGILVTGFDRILPTYDSIGSRELLERLIGGGNTFYIEISNGQGYTPDGVTTDMSNFATMYQSTIMQAMFFLYTLKSAVEGLAIHGKLLNQDAEKALRRAFMSAKDLCVRLGAIDPKTSISNLSYNSDTNEWTIGVDLYTRKPFSYATFVVTLKQ